MNPRLKKMGSLLLDCVGGAVFVFLLAHSVSEGNLSPTQPLLTPGGGTATISSCPVPQLALSTSDIVWDSVEKSHAFTTIRVHVTPKNTTEACTVPHVLRVVVQNGAGEDLATGEHTISNVSTASSFPIPLTHPVGAGTDGLTFLTLLQPVS
jgi:hypothetical protein